MEINRHLYQADLLKSNQPLSEALGGTGVRSVADIQLKINAIPNNEVASKLALLNSSVKVPTEQLPAGFGSGQNTQSKYAFQYKKVYKYDSRLTLIVSGIETFGIPANVKLLFNDVEYPYFVDAPSIDTNVKGLYISTISYTASQPTLSALDVVLPFSEGHVKIIFDDRIIEFNVVYGQPLAPSGVIRIPFDGVVDNTYFYLQTSGSIKLTGKTVTPMGCQWEVSEDASFQSNVTVVDTGLGGSTGGYGLILLSKTANVFNSGILGDSGTYHVRARYIATVGPDHTPVFSDWCEPYTFDFVG